MDVATSESTITTQAHLLASTMSLLGIDEIIIDNTDEAEVDKDLIYTEGNPALTDEQEEMIADLAFPFFQQIQAKVDADDQHNFDSLYAYITVDKGLLNVRANVNFEELDSRDIEIQLGPTCEAENEDADPGDTESLICELLRKFKVTELEFRYSGSGDSGGTDEFSIVSELDMDSKTETELQDLIEKRVWDYTAANFDNEGSAGSVHLVIEDDYYSFVGEHGDNQRDSYTFEETYEL